MTNVYNATNPLYLDISLLSYEQCFLFLPFPHHLLLVNRITFFSIYPFTVKYSYSIFVGFVIFG